MREQCAGRRELPALTRNNFMYTRDSQSYAHELIGAGNYTLLPAADRYIVGASIQQSALNSTSVINCGTTAIARNYGKDFPFNEMMYHCTDAVVLSKTGNDSAAFIITVLDSNKFTNTLIASVSGEINFASNSAMALGNTAHMLWFALGILVLLQAVSIGTYFFKK